jgi:hypothetical protein
VRRAALLASLVALVAAPPAAAVPRTLDVNLDRDAARERLVVTGERGVGQRVVLVDTCRGEPVRYRLTRSWHGVDRLVVRNLDRTTRRPEVLIDARDGAAGHVGVIKVVRHKGARCPTPRTLFRYATDRPHFPPPAGYGITQFWVSAYDYRPRVRGLELRLSEYYVDADDSLCCPSAVRRTLFRYARSRDAYVPYRTTVRPFETP